MGSESKGLKEEHALLDGKGFLLPGAWQAEEGVEWRVIELGVEGDSDIIEDGEGLAESNILESPTDSQAGDVVGAEAGDRLVTEANSAFGWLIDAGDEVKEGGFASAVGADDSMGATFGDAKIAIRSGANAAETFGEILDFEE